jgi:holin-like protein
MLWSLSVLLACAAAGEALRHVTGLPVPGAVIGMILLFIGLYAAGRNTAEVSLPAADGMLSYLSLFFVVPGVGAGMRLINMGPVWPAIVLGILGSSVLTLAVAGWLVQALLARQDRRLIRPAPARVGGAS